MIVGSYTVGSFSVRVKYPKYNERIHSAERTPELCGKFDTRLIFQRFKACLDLVRDTLDCLTIVNGCLVSINIIKVMYDIGKNYSKKILIISPTIARAQAMMKNVTRQELNNNGNVLVITLTTMFDELLVYQNRNGTLFPVKRRSYDKRNVIIESEKMVKIVKPEIVFINYDIRQYEEANRILPRFHARHLVPFEKYIPFLTIGGLEVALSIYNETFWKIKNFTLGFSAFSDENKKIKDVIHFGTEYPFTIHQIYNHTSYFMKYSYEVMCKREETLYSSEMCFLHFKFEPRNVNKILVKFDEYGVPHVGEIPELFPYKFDMIPKNTFIQHSTFENSQSLADKFKNLNVNPTEDINSENFTLSTKEEEISITDAIILIKKENLCGIEVKKGEKRMMLKIDDEEEWIPSYISLRTGKPIFGQQAKLDYEDHPESVIFDIFKLIGKKYNEINHDPKWGFIIEQVEDTDDFNIMVKIVEEKRIIPIEIVVAIVLQSLKSFIENNINSENLTIQAEADYALTDKDKSIFLKACERIGITFLL